MLEPRTPEEQRLDALEDRSLNGDQIARSGVEELREENTELVKQVRELWSMLSVQGRMLSRMRQAQLVKSARRRSFASSRASRKKNAKT